MTQDLLNICLNDPVLPRSSYRKATGACAPYNISRIPLQLLIRNHISLPQTSRQLKGCFYVTIWQLGEELAPHRDIQNHRHLETLPFPLESVTGRVLQVYEDDIWTNQDSCDKWVIWDARNTFHRVTTVEGERIFVYIPHPTISESITPEWLGELRRADFQWMKSGKMDLWMKQRMMKRIARNVLRIRSWRFVKLRRCSRTWVYQRRKDRHWF